MDQHNANNDEKSVLKKYSIVRDNLSIFAL
jgi:hypothetical protein